MEADRWLERVRAQRSHLPELHELAEVEGELRGLIRSLQSAQDALSPVQAAYEHARDEAQRLRDRAGALEATLSASTANARDLAAMQGELEHVRGLLEQVDDRELELLVELEPLEGAVTTIRGQAQPATVRRAELQASIAELQASLDEELVSLRAGREECARGVAPELLARYESALQRAGGSGAAQVVSGRCDGCRLALSPLDLDRWKAQAPDAFMACPECGRLLLP